MSNKIIKSYFGSYAEAARRLGVEPMTVSQWAKRGIPLKRAIQIEKITGGAITKEQLCPDDFDLAPADKCSKEAS